MTISCTDLLSLGRSLRKSSSTEAELRCCASRMYYGALHTVDSTFEEHGPVVNGRHPSTHEIVIGKALHAARQKSKHQGAAATVAKLLTKIKKLRKHADYDLDLDFLSKHADEMVEDAGAIARLCVGVKHRPAAVSAAAAPARRDPDEESPPRDDQESG